MKKNALVLFAHGARDPRWAQPFLKLQAIAGARLPDTQVELAFLELMEPRLPAVVGRLAEQGCERISVVPVFLGQGGHVLRDLPPMIDELRSAHPGLQLTVADAVGESPAVLEAIADYCVGRLPA
ncbi:MAG: CbiX/SirB N-terminal domain-containing protein [Burkholderiaceae bacterium]|jgi:sirohydrochlorin cobaltochelatase|nr:CbiX/SirB N-terminal domain-containing protein [Burkholderiaceae bacterium]